MKFVHRVIILSSIGFGLGVIMGVMITAFSATLSYADGTLYLCSKELIEAVGDPLTAFTIQALISGLFGSIAMGGSSVYSIEKWGLVKCTAVHYVSTMVFFYILAFSMRWFTIREIDAVLIMFGVMSGAYVIVWLANHISCKLQLKKINRELEEFKLPECEGTK